MFSTIAAASIGHTLAPKSDPQKRQENQDKIGVRVGRVLNKYKVGKHFKLDIRDDSLASKSTTQRSLRKLPLTAST